MRISTRDTTLVRPTEATPKGSLWLTNIDIWQGSYYIPTLYVYRRVVQVANFFDPAVLKAALARALVAFYPAAGRLTTNEDGRLEINCNDEGALFVEAECDATLDDLGDFFLPKPDLNLVPKVDYSKGVSAYPLLLFQVTRFKCGGLCLGFMYNHSLADGISSVHLFNTVADIARGLDISVLPIIDRSHLKARSSPKPQFEHIEYCKPFFPATVSSNYKSPPSTILSTFKITRDHLNALKFICNDEKDDDISYNYSSYEVLGAHIWRCVCKARGQAEDEGTRILIPVDGRTRLEGPTLPRGYFGNVVFPTVCNALSGEIQSKPLKHVVRIIHDAIVKMNNDYLRSCIDYLELQPDILSLKSPKILITSRVRLPVYDADFGWGKPVYVGLASITPQGMVVIYPSPINDGSLLLSLSLEKEHMKLFEEILYQI